MSERVEAAARAVANIETGKGEPVQEIDQTFAKVVIEAADAVLFSEEAIERAAEAVSHDWPFYNNYYPDQVRTVIRAVVAALRGEA